MPSVTGNTSTTWTVPSSVPSGLIGVIVEGAGGGSGDDGGSGTQPGAGGPGGRITGHWPVSGGEDLTLYGAACPSSPWFDGGPGSTEDGSTGGDGGGAAAVVVTSDGTIIAAADGGGGAGATNESIDSGVGDGGGGARGGAGADTASDGDGTGFGGDGTSGILGGPSDDGNPGGTEAGGSLTNVAQTQGGATNGAPSGTSLTQGGDGRAVAEPVPVAPTVTIGTPTATTLPLSWSDVDYEDEYIVEYRVVGAGSWTEFSRPTAGATGGTITGLTEGVAYEVRVASSNTVATEYSSVQTETTYLPPNSNVGVSNVTADSADISWTDNASDEDAHRVLRTRGPRYFAFDGTDDVVTFDHGAADLSGDDSWTVGAWVYWDGGNSGSFADIAHLGSFEVRLAKGANDNWQAWFNDGSNSYITEEPATQGQWVHLAGRLQTDTLSLWVDGSQADSTSTTAVPQDNPADNTIGDGPGGPFSGRIRDVTIYDVALSDSQMGTLATAATPAPGDLLAHYPLHEDRSGSTPDMSGYTHPGTVSGATVGGDAYVDASGALAADTTGYTLSSLLNGEQYTAKTRVETADAEAETK